METLIRVAGLVMDVVVLVFKIKEQSKSRKSSSMRKPVKKSRRMSRRS